jgi:flavin reductase (DIM6/NTAB) family NADH-FMN oxidoreductase RutF
MTKVAFDRRAAMAKKTTDYRDHLEETVRAFGENRVLLVSRGKEGLPNVMAIGWGTAGIIWRRAIFVVLVRPSRHTYKLIEETGEFTVNIVPPQLEQVVQYCGSVSGRDYDKFKEKHLTAIPSKNVKTPIIRECILHFECRVIYRNDLIPSELEKSIIDTLYPKGDFHRVYFGEILACQHEV